MLGNSRLLGAVSTAVLMALALSGGHCLGGSLASRILPDHEYEETSPQDSVPQVVKPKEEATTSGLEADEIETGIKMLATLAAPLKAKNVSEQEIRKQLLSKSVDFVTAAVDKQSQDALDATEQRAAEDLVTEALKRQKKPASPPPPPLPAVNPIAVAVPPSTPPSPSRLEPYLAFIYQASVEDFKRLRQDASLDDAKRKDHLLGLIETRCAALLKIPGDDISKLEASDHALAKQVRDEVVAGKTGPELQKDSRISVDLIRELKTAINARSNELKLEGSIPGTDNHTKQLREYAESEAKTRAKITDDLTAKEKDQIDSLVTTPPMSPDFLKRIQAIATQDGGRTTEPLGSSKLTADVNSRILNLLRQINRALLPLNFDQNGRRAVMVEFLKKKFSDVATEAESLADQVLREQPGTSTTNVGTANVPMITYPMIMQPAYLYPQKHCLFCRP
jgi:hypothetical protein